MRLLGRLRQLPPHSLTAEAEGGYLCCSRTSAMPSSPSQRASWTTWGNGLPTTPTAAYLVAEGGKRKTPRCLLNPHVVCGVCAMKCGGGPAQPTYTTSPSLPYTNATCKRPPRLLRLYATSLHWAYGPPYSLSCGRQVPDVGIPHYRDARMQHSQSRQPALPGVTTAVAPRRVPASTNEVFPASPT